MQASSEQQPFSPEEIRQQALFAEAKKEILAVVSEVPYDIRPHVEPENIIGLTRSEMTTWHTERMSSIGFPPDEARKMGEEDTQKYSAMFFPDTRSLAVQLWSYPSHTPEDVIRQDYMYRIGHGLGSANNLLIPDATLSQAAEALTTTPPQLQEGIITYLTYQPYVIKAFLHQRYSNPQEVMAHVSKLLRLDELTYFDAMTRVLTSPELRSTLFEAFNVSEEDFRTFVEEHAESIDFRLANRAVRLAYRNHPTEQKTMHVGEYAAFFEPHAEGAIAEMYSLYFSYLGYCDSKRIPPSREALQQFATSPIFRSLITGDNIMIPAGISVVSSLGNFEEAVRHILPLTRPDIPSLPIHEKSQQPLRRYVRSIIHSNYFQGPLGFTIDTPELKIRLTDAVISTLTPTKQLEVRFNAQLNGISLSDALSIYFSQHNPNEQLSSLLYAQAMIRAMMKDRDFLSVLAESSQALTPLRLPERAIDPEKEPEALTILRQEYETFQSLDPRKRLKAVDKTFDQAVNAKRFGITLS